MPEHRLTFADPQAPALPLHVVLQEEAEGFLAGLAAADRGWLAAQGWTGGATDPVLLPGKDGTVAGAVLGLGDAKARARGRFSVARAVAKLPEGAWEIRGSLSGEALEEAALGWLLAGYRFDRYRAAKVPGAKLRAPAGVDALRLEIIANAEALTRDLVNTPAADMGPDELEAAFRALGAEFGAEVAVIKGEELLAQNFPMIHAVGRASARAPRLLDLRWGSTGPKVTLVGKGVCFDTGGLDLKPSAGMLQMKKDMGGAATSMGLARMIMASGMAVQLRLLVPAVENMVGGNALKPRDILTSRKGLTVEVNDTDAEGRLVLGDALAYGCEESPDLIVSLATLTGAARVALGPELPPYYTDDERFAEALDAAALRARDPLWRMPFWEPYEAVIEPGIADLDNSPIGAGAGSITAALFLRRFVSVPRYAHFDIFCLQPAEAPARPKGGIGQASRALFEAIPAVLGVK